MEMIDPKLMLSFPAWQLVAFLGAVTLCTLFKKSIGTVIFAFLFAIHWVFWQARAIKTEGQEYTWIAIFFSLGLICALSLAWHIYKADQYE